MSTQQQESTTVLVVEDNPIDAEKISRFLVQGGWVSENIRIANAAEGAVKLFNDNPPDCLILDYRLSDLDGLSFLREIKASAERPSPAVIIITGQGNESVAVEAMKLGAYDYVTKENMTLERLCDAVRGAIRQRKLERESRERLEGLTTFVNAVSHDLRRPLTSLGLNLDLLLSDASMARQEEGFRESLDAAVQSYEQLKDMLESLYRLITSDSTRFERAVVNLYDAVHDALRSLQPVVEGAGATVVCDRLPDVLADKPIIIEVLQNLIDNAISHNDNPEPMIRIRPAFDQHHDSYTMAGLVIIDNGSGLTTEVKQRMFEPMWRGDKALQPQNNRKHSGLGLSICLRLMERVGGTIVADNDPAGGARFFMLFSSVLVGTLASIGNLDDVCVPEV